MSIPLEGGNKSVVVYCSRPVINAHKGAHDKRNVAVSKRTGSITSKTKISSRSFSSKATLRSQRKVDTRTPSQLKTIVNLSESQQVFHSLIRRGTISKEAKAVYSAALGILSEVSKCKDFSATNIQKAIKIGLGRVATTTGLKGTVSFFDFTKDDPTQTGQSYLKTDQDRINACVNVGISQDKTEKTTARFRQNLPQYDKEKHPDGISGIDASFSLPTEGDSNVVYFFQKGENKEVMQDLKITCPKDFPINEYTDQLCAEASTYSGDITIKKAEPGSVFVRVFGKGQSPLRPCWCNAGDINSAVTNAKDLYDKLAVKFEWNGDGNMAVLVVPKDIEIYFAEGKIASQVGTYKKTVIDEKEKEVETEYKFIFQGGGTQTNILAKNVAKDCHRPFANKMDKEIWQKIMFVFHDDGIIDIQELLQPPAQNSQKSEQK